MFPGRKIALFSLHIDELGLLGFSGRAVLAVDFRCQKLAVREGIDDFHRCAVGDVGEEEGVGGEAVGVGVLLHRVAALGIDEGVVVDEVVGCHFCGTSCGGVAGRGLVVPHALQPFLVDVLLHHFFLGDGSVGAEEVIDVPVAAFACHAETDDGVGDDGLFLQIVGLAGQTQGDVGLQGGCARGVVGRRNAQHLNALDAVLVEVQSPVFGVEEEGVAAVAVAVDGVDVRVP